MKKKSERKLSLSKIKIAGLSRHNQQMIKAGGLPQSGHPLPTLATNVVRCILVTECACVQTKARCIK